MSSLKQVDILNSTGQDQSDVQKGPDLEKAVSALKEQQLPANFSKYSIMLESVPFFSDKGNEQISKTYIDSLKACGKIENSCGEQGIVSFCAVAKAIGGQFPTDLNKIPDFVSDLKTNVTEAYHYIVDGYTNGTLNKGDEEDLCDMFNKFVNTKNKEEKANNKEEKANNKEEKANNKEQLSNNKYELTEKNKIETLKKLDQILSNPANAEANAKFKELMVNKGLNPDSDEDRIRFISDDDNKTLISMHVTPLVKHDKEGFMKIFPKLTQNSLTTTSALQNISTTLKKDPESAVHFQNTINNIQGQINVKGQECMDAQSKFALAEMSIGKDQLNQKTNEFLKELFQNPSSRNSKTNEIIGDKTLEQLTQEEKVAILDSEKFYDTLMTNMTSELQKYAAEQVVDATGRQARACIEAFQREGNTVENIKYTNGAITCDVIVKNGEVEFTQKCKFENGKFIVTDVYAKEDGKSGAIKPSEKTLMTFPGLNILAGAADIDLLGANNIKDKDEFKRYINDQIAKKLASSESLKVGDGDYLRKYSDQQSFKMAMKQMYNPKEAMDSGKPLDYVSNPNEYSFLSIALNTLESGKYDTEALADSHLKDFLEATSRYSVGYPKIDTLKVLEDLGIVTQGVGGEILDIDKLKKLNASLIKGDEESIKQSLESGLGVNLANLGYNIKKSNISNGMKAEVWLEKSEDNA